VTIVEEGLRLPQPTIVPPRAFRAYGWKSVVAATGALTFVAAIMLPGALVFSAIAVPIAILGAGYAAVALPLTLLRWRAAGQVVADADPAELQLVAGFRTASQRLTLAFTAVLLANLGLGAVLLSVGPIGVIGTWLFIFVGIVAQIVGLGSVWANARWLHRPSYLLGEHQAIRDHRGAWLLIIVNRALTCAMWVGYIVGAFVFYNYAI